jgi:hypothetical protein
MGPIPVDAIQNGRCFFLPIDPRCPTCQRWDDMGRKLKNETSFCQPALLLKSIEKPDKICKFIFEQLLNLNKNPIFALLMF